MLAFSERSFRQILPEAHPLRQLTAVLPLATGRILLGTEKSGVLFYDGKRLAEFHPQLAKLHVTALAGDDSSVWVGTLSDGVIHWHSGQADRFTESDGLPDPRVLSLAIAGDRTFVGNLPADDKTARIAALRRGLIPALVRLKDFAGAVDQYVEILNKFPEDEGLAQGSGAPSKVAPDVVLTQGESGSEGDLETRIDVPPLPGGPGAPGAEALKKLLHAAPLQAALEFQRLQNIGQSPFIEPHSAFVIRSSADWGSEGARNALRTAVEGLLTTSQIGVNWVENHEGNASYFQVDGLVHLTVATKGPILIVADSAETLIPLLANPRAAGTGPNVVYAAGFRHSAERENIVKMMRMIETPLEPKDAGTPGQPGREPLFFSENLASLSQSLESIESESLVVEDRGSQLRQTVTYRLNK